jgi:pimeloyl-ACP methyl ester carboxylesterase
MDPSQRAILIGRVKRRLKIVGALLGLIVLALVVVYFAAPQWLMHARVDWEARHAHLQEKSVRAGDTRWSYYEGGQGPTLLLLHGFGNGKEVWLPVAQYLTPNFHVLIPDLPGWGDSSRIAHGNYDYSAQADRLRAFVQKLDPGGIAVAGHSMGGAIAGVYAAQYPQDVGALILVDSAGAPPGNSATARAAKAGRDPAAIEDRADLERARELAFANPPWLPPRFRDVLVARARADRAFEDRVFAQLTAPGQRDILTVALPKVTAPTLAIWCRQDRVIDSSALDAIRARLTSVPRISVTEFNGCGHLSILERPREVADTIAHFVLMP